ncbi:BYPASS-related protein [Tanacetum coccineum]
MLVEMADMTQQAPLGTVENVLVKIDKFVFPCNFIVIDMPGILKEMMILGRPFLATIHAQINVFNKEISLGIGGDRHTGHLLDDEKITGHEAVYGKGAHGMLKQCVCFQDHERRTIKGSCMGFAYFLQVRYGNQKIDDTTQERMYYEWIAQNYDFDDDRTPSTSDKYPYNTHYPTPLLLQNPPHDEWNTKNHTTYDIGSTSDPSMVIAPKGDADPFPQRHLKKNEKTSLGKSTQLPPIKSYPCDYSLEEWLKSKIGYTNVANSDREIVFIEWVLDSFDVKDEYTKQFGDPYSRRFNEYKRIFNNEGFEEDELWRSSDEKTAYEPPIVDIETFEVKKYSFKGGEYEFAQDMIVRSYPLANINLKIRSNTHGSFLL